MYGRLSRYCRLYTVDYLGTVDYLQLASSCITSNIPTTPPPGLRKLHALESAMRSWELNTCIRFREKLPSDVNYVRFSSGKG